MKTLDVLSSNFFNGAIFQQQDYQCLKRSLAKFCKTGKKEDAFSVYFCFCEIFKVFGTGYDTIDKLLQLLSDHEYHSGELLSKHRDHYSHSVYVFSIGLAIYAYDSKYKNIFNQFYQCEEEGFLKLWGLTSLFHDIGYPFELAHQQIKSYAEDLWGENSELSPFVSYEHMGELLKLNEEGKKLNKLLAEGICKRLEYPLEAVDPILEYRYKGNQNYMDHGYFSTVLLARQLIQANIKIEASILDVLTAILLHNSINKFDLSGVSRPISAVQHPLAYLLMLCDELQCWDRIAFGYVSKKDPLAWNIKMSLSKDELVIQYIFDSFVVSNPINAAKEENKNANKILNGKMQKGIEKIIVPHTTIFIQAIEQDKEKKTFSYASSNSLMNLCDFAKAIHKSYQKLYGGDDFEKLSLEFKLSNIEQAKTYSEKLELINCFYSDKELDYPVVNSFSNSNYDEVTKKTSDDIGFLAREEHVRWVKEKLASGWSYGTEYKDSKERNEKRIHKDIVPYEALTEKEKAKDILMIDNIIPLLYEQGHKVRVYRFRYGRKPTLDIAGIGHRNISTDKEVLKQQIKEILKYYSKYYRVVVRTSFAYGADQLIAECANELGITTKAVLPLSLEEYIENIRRDTKTTGYSFNAEDELHLRHLLAQTVVCKSIPDDKHTYLEAAKYIIEKADKVIAIWDGVELPLEDKNHTPINQGGTYHCIQMALDKKLVMEEDIHIIKCKR